MSKVTQPLQNRDAKAREDRAESAGFREFQSTSQALLSSSQLILQQEKSKERLDQFFSDHSDAIFFFTLGGKLLKVNETFSKRFALHSDAFFLQELETVIPQRVAQVFREQASGLGSKGFASFELSLPQDPSKPYGAQVEHHWSLQRYGKSEIYGDIFVATGRDIQDLRNAEGRISELFRCLPIGLLTITSDERIEEVYSKYSEVILGTSELTGRSFFEKVFHPSLPYMTESEVAAVQRFHDIIGKRMDEYMDLEKNLPRMIRRATPPQGLNPDSVLWLALSYYPIATTSTIEKILVIVQNQTDWVKEKLERENLHRLSLTDELTSLGNRRSLDLELDKLLRSPEGTDVGLVLVDVDFFKKFNDHYGHLHGDECLRKISASLQEMAEGHKDIELSCFRYGGEEFAFMAKGVSGERLSVVVTEFLAKVRGLALAHAGRKDGTDVVTVSAGALYHRIDGLCGLTGKALLSMADRLLYQSKNSGRDRVTVASSLDYATIFGDESQIKMAG